MERKGAQNHYRALILEADYRTQQTKCFLEQIHGGSVRSMIAALCNADSLQEGELSALRRWLEER